MRPKLNRLSISLLLALGVFFVSEEVEAQTSRPSEDNGVLIEWVVRTPASTRKDATVYIIGSPVELGAWGSPGKALTRRADGAHAISVRLPRGRAIDYKITRGSWDTVEKGSKGEEIANRRLDVEKQSVVEITVGSWAAESNDPATSRPSPASRRTGTIRTHDRFKSKALSNERILWVWLPPDYETSKNARYPVLYMHDGQNLFDSTTAFIGIEWGADETADRLIRAGRIPPIIIVGIANTPDRMGEYTPWVDESRNSGGKGDAYARFLIDEVKPFIDQSYRTKSDRMNTAVAGSSLGGLISLHLALTHPEVFSKCAAISPSLMWADGRMLREIEAKPSSLKGVRLWFDMGTREGRQIESFNSATKWTRQLATALEKGGLKPDVDYRYLEVEGGEHNEAVWAARLDQILVFLFSQNDR